VTSRKLRVVSTLFAVPVVAAVWLALSSASVDAQGACVAEVEPNDDPALAAPISGPKCVEGQLSEADKDSFVWTVAETSAGQRWTVELEGAPDQLTALGIFRLEFEDPGDEEPSDVEELATFEDRPGIAPLRVEDLLLQPGTYYLQVAGSGEESYRLGVSGGPPLPTRHEREPNDEDDEATRLSGPFAISGDLEDSEDWFVWTVSKADARQRWQLGAQGPIGSDFHLDLFQANGRDLDDTTSGEAGRASLEDLGLEAGRYLVRVGPETQDANPSAFAAISLGERAADHEEEPNDATASAVPIVGRSVTGRLVDDEDADLYRLSVTDELAAQRLDVSLATMSGATRRLCLLNAAGDELHCREAEGSVAIGDLRLGTGEHVLSVTGGGDLANDYVLRVEPTGAVADGIEAEPNDTHETANSLNGQLAIRGRLIGSEVDTFRFTVEGEPQLWRVQAIGDGISSLSYLNAGGQEEQVREAGGGGGLVRLSNLFLLPGEHAIAIRGADATYALRAIPIGLPDPGAEREPNDDPSRAHVLRVGEPRNGLLADTGDRDAYRFFLAAEEHVVLRFEPPADGSLAFALDWGNSRVAERSGLPNGEPIVYEALLHPGEYTVLVRPVEPSGAEYRVALERRDPFTLPADLEPNDTPAQARPFPPTLVVDGGVGGDDVDWYRLSGLSQPTTATITTTGEVQPSLVSPDGTLELTDGKVEGVRTGVLPAATPLWLRVGGEGPYSVTVAFAAGPGAEPEPGELPVAMSLELPEGSVAAFSSFGQLLDAGLVLRNEGTLPHDLTLDVVLSHYAWQASLAERTIRVAPGESRTVPLTIRVAADAWADQPVQLSVRARAPDGRQRTVAAELTARRDVAPVAPQRAWPLPDALLGGLDVAASAFGGAPVVIGDGPAGGTEEDLIEEQAVLHDGVTPLDLGFRWDASALPLSLTVDLAGDDPVPIGGVLLTPHPRSNGGPVERLRAFDVLLSTDGTTFTEAYSGELSPLPMEQVFAFDAPVPARYAQLRLRSTYGGESDRVVLGEWKIVAAPDATPIGSAGFNLADPVNGGHLVWAHPQLDDEVEDANAVLTQEDEALDLQRQPGTRPEWVIGFHHDRAAQLTQIEWVDLPDGDSKARFTDVELSVSLESPVGPWQPLGTWKLERNGDRVTPYLLPEPTWARYVRFAAGGPERRAETWEIPATIRIIERSIGGSYRSILGEWGHEGREGIHEALAAVEPANQVDDRNQGDAEPLSLGDRVSGHVQIETRTDRYRIDVPAGRNTLRFTVAGQPTVGVQVTLETDEGQPVDVRWEQSLPEQAVISATVEPGRSYVVEIAEAPRSVVFAFDTSGSVDEYKPVIYGALASFAGDVAPGLQVANYLPFEERLLLTDWGDQAYALQAALNNYPRTTESSAVEPTLRTASRALGSRPGAKVIVVITDGDSPGYPETDALWADLMSAQPRIFAIQLQLAEEHFQDRRRQQDTLQDWASVNGGHYSTFRTQAELDVAFDRAATRLRQPAGYTLTASATFEKPPGPGAIRVNSRGRPDPSPHGDPRPSVRGTVELVLDTSGSMLEPLRGRVRIDIAKAALRKLVRETLPPGIPVALRVFAPEGTGRCGTTLEVPLGPLDPETMAARIESLQIRRSTETPIAAAIRAVADDLAEVSGPRIVVLVTDGQETCRGNPAKAIKRLVAAGLDVHVNIVGFAVSDRKLKARFRQWARIGNGVYRDATTGADLEEAVEQALQPPFRVLDGNGALVAAGVVNGDPVRVPAGVYTVEVASEPATVFEEVEVAAGDTVRLVLPVPS
jgi:Mg-chelatase subunit ChlD